MKKRRNLMLLAVIALAIGYAAVATTLNLNGLTSIGIAHNDFDVYFSDARVDGVQKIRLITSDTTISFKKELKTVGEKYELEYDVTNGSKNYDADISINCVGENEYLSVTNEFNTTETLKATETRTGKLTIEVIKSYVGTTENPKLDTEISCEIVGNAVERNNKATGTPVEKVDIPKWIITDDADDNGELSIGDLITMGTESFYVTSIGEDTIKALAQYNLYVGNSIDENNVETPLENPTGLQNPLAVGANYDENNKIIYPIIAATQYKKSIPISYNESIVKNYVDTYGEVLNDLGGQVSEIGLITKEELEKLGCDSSSRTCKYSQYSWVYSTSYWRYSNSGANPHAVTNSGYYTINYQNRTKIFGVRPIITIPKSLVEFPKPDKVWSLIKDTDKDGKVSIGDKIRFNTESFYVYKVYEEEGNEKIDALSVQNVDPIVNLQSTTAEKVAFDKTFPYEYEGSNIQQVVNAYREKLNQLGGNIDKIGLIGKQDLMDLGCVLDSDGTNTSCYPSPYSWINLTSYWTSTPYSEYEVFTVSNTWITYNNAVRDDIAGVRPVITISKSLFD